MKKITVFIMFGMIMVSMQVFSGGRQGARDGVVVLDYAHYAVGTHLSRPWWEAVHARFIERWGNQIELRIEELPSDTLYADRMRVLAAARQLPDVIDGKDGIRTLAIQNGQAVELTPFLNRDPDFRDKVINPASMAANTDADGRVFSVYANSQVIGYYYNIEHFQRAGISPAGTWDQWFSNLERLKSTGVYPLALMTGENSWTTNLILSARVASRGNEGQTFMNTRFPQTYQIPLFIDSLADIQRMLQSYATPDALGGVYANAANQFLTEQAAIIANGPWMVADFSNTEKVLPGFERKVGWAMYPGEGLVTSFAEGFTLCSPPERQEAGWLLLQALTDRDSQLNQLRLMGTLPGAVDLQIPDDVRQRAPLVVEHANALSRMKYHGDTFSVTAHASVIDAFGRFYPELAAGRMTPAAMAAQLDQAAAGARF